MSKFKVGDKVVRLDGTPTEMLHKILGSKEYYIVTYVSNCGRWIQLDGVQHLGDAAPWGSINFKLYQEPNDELPPVPDSVMYFNSVRDEDNDQRLVVEMTSSNAGKWSDEANAHVGLMVIPRTGSTLSSNAIGINLSPDAALQLAHDIRRMAMTVRREGRDG